MSSQITLYLQSLKCSISPAMSLLPNRLSSFVQRATNPLDPGNRGAETLPYSQSRLTKPQSENKQPTSHSKDLEAKKTHEPFYICQHWSLSHTEAWVNSGLEVSLEEQPHLESPWFPVAPGKHSSSSPKNTRWSLSLGSNGLLNWSGLSKETEPIGKWKWSESESVNHSFVSDSDPMDCSPPVSSVHGILQARILEWVAIPFSRWSFWPRDRTRVSCITGRFFTIWATREAW